MSENAGRPFGHLLVSLLLIMFFLSGIQTGKFWLCSLIAALQHYMWLVSFIWMNVLSISLYRVFSSNLHPKKTSYGLSVIHAYFVPLVVVSICLVLQEFDYFQYGSLSLCWIVGRLQLGLSFALPVAAVLAANLTSSA
jgi:hypothetical protein